MSYIKEAIEELKQDTENIEEAFFDKEYRAERAWKLDELMSCMNNEEAYYMWLYTWPDGCTKEECREYFGDEQDFQDLEETFEHIYRRFHKDGLYDVSKELELLAYEYDRKLGLPRIEIIRKVTEEINLNESEVFDRLDNLETELAELEKEIKGLEALELRAQRDYLDNNAEYKMLKKEYQEVQERLEELRSKFGRWVRGGRYGDDVDWEEDANERKKYEPELSELETKSSELWKKLDGLEKAIKDELKNRSQVSTKKAEKQARIDLKNQTIKQALVEEHDNLEKIRELINEEEAVLSDTGRVGNGYFYTTIDISQSYDVEDDDFDWDYEDGARFKESKIEEWAEDLAEETLPDFAELAEENNWVEVEKQKFSTWYLIPDSGWEINDEYDYESDGEPEITNYYSSPGTYWDPPECDYDIEPDSVDVTIKISLRKKLKN